MCYLSYFVTSPKVVWSDDTFGNNGIIHVYNLTTETDAKINSSNASYLAIYGNTVLHQLDQEII